MDWLDAAFAQAQKDGVEAIVIQVQADMWDLDSKPASHLANYEPLIGNIAAHTIAFDKPVLLFNGDSHHYRSDNPLKQGQPCVFEAATGTDTVACSSIPAAIDFTPDAWNNHPGYNVPNVPPGRRARQHGAVGVASSDHHARRERSAELERIRTVQLGAHPAAAVGCSRSFRRFAGADALSQSRRRARHANAGAHILRHTR